MPNVKPTKPETLKFADDGSVPNNPRLPFILYRGAIDLSGTPDPEDVIESVFTENGWGEMWRNGVYEYMLPFHDSRSHGHRAAAPR